MHPSNHFQLHPLQVVPHSSSGATAAWCLGVYEAAKEKFVYWPGNCWWTFSGEIEMGMNFFFCFGWSEPPTISKLTVQEAVISISTVFNIYQSPKFNSSFLRNGSWKTILSYREGNFWTFITPQNCCSDPLAGLLESAPASPSLPPVGESEGFRGCKPEELLRCLWWNKLAFIFGQQRSCWTYFRWKEVFFFGFVGMIRAGSLSTN